MQKLINFLNVEIWRIRISELSKFKAFWVRFLRIILLTKKAFAKNQLEQDACTLTYYTLLGIVPIIILFLGIARGFALEDTLVNFILERFSNQREILTKIITLAENSLKHVKGGLIAGAGLIVLIWTVIKILKNLEIAFNRIWEVKKERNLSRQFSDYLVIVLISPFLLIIANGSIVFLSTKIAGLKEQSSFFREIGFVLFLFLNLLPYFLTCFLFGFIYMFMPNTRVHFRSAIYGGLIAGTLYQLVQWLYVVFQISVTSYNPLYGTFAAIPFFFVWLHLSWTILLLGGKITFAFQHVDAYEFITEDFILSHRFKTILGLRIAHFCIKRFCEEKAPPSDTEISNTLAIPLIITRQLLALLIKGNILSETKKGESEEWGYQPAVDVDKLTIKKVLDMINEGGEAIPLPPSSEVEIILKKLDEFSSVIEKSDANLILKNI